MRFWTGGFRCRYLGEVPEGSGADAEVRFRRLAVHIPRSGSGRFR